MISTHVLDLVTGRPADGLAVTLDELDAGGGWTPRGAASTNADGRAGPLASAADLAGKTVRLRFETGAHFSATQRPCFFPVVDVVFVVEPGQARYHVPLLLSAFGYSTYRGS